MAFWAVHEKIGTIFCLVGKSVGGMFLMFVADSCCGLRFGSLFLWCGWVVDCVDCYSGRLIDRGIPACPAGLTRDQ